MTLFYFLAGHSYRAKSIRLIYNVVIVHYVTNHPGMLNGGLYKWKVQLASQKNDKLCL